MKKHTQKNKLTRLLMAFTLAFSLQPLAFVFAGTNASVMFNTNTGALSAPTASQFYANNPPPGPSNALTNFNAAPVTFSSNLLVSNNVIVDGNQTNYGVLAVAGGANINGVLTTGSSISAGASITTAGGVNAANSIIAPQGNFTIGLTINYNPVLTNGQTNASLAGAFSGAFTGSGLGLSNTYSIAAIPGEGIVGSYTVLNHQGLASGNTAAMLRIGYQSGPYPVQNIRTWWDNFAFDSYVWTSNNYSFTNEVSLEYPAGTFYRLTFNGATNITMKPGQPATPTDPLGGVTLPANTLFWIRCYRTCTNGAQWPYGAIVDNNGYPGGLWQGALGAVQDLTLTGTVTNAFTYGFGPSAITGLRADNCKTPPATVVVLGDSIFADDGATYYDQSLATFSLSNTVCFANFSADGSALANEAANLFLTNAIPPLGNVLLHQTKVNDIRAAGNNSSFTTLTNLLISEWKYFTASGMKVFETTCTPVSTSSDTFETLANQTIDANNAVRVQVNDWLRTNVFPGVAVIDLASMVESSLDSGKWQVNGSANFMTADGLHPSATGVNYLLTNGLWTAALQQIFQWQNGAQNIGSFSGAFSGSLTLAFTNAAPTHVTNGVTAPDLWFPITYNGTNYMVAGFKNH